MVAGNLAFRYTDHALIYPQITPDLVSLMFQTGQRIRLARIRKVWSQEFLAEKARIKPETLRGIENGKRKPRYQTLRKIAVALSIEPEELVFEEDVSCNVPRKALQIEAWPKATIAGKGQRIALYLTAQLILRKLQMSLSPCLMLPTGRTAALLFRTFELYTHRLDLSVFATTQFFVDTETFGVSADHPASRVRFVMEHFVEPMRRRKVHIPDDNIKAFTGFFTKADTLERFDSLLRQFPPTVHPLAFSPKGEVIGYGPIRDEEFEQYLSHGSRIIHLSEEDHQYIDPHQPSRAVITIGLNNLLSADMILLLALHSNKNQALSHFLKNRNNSATLMHPIKSHKNTVIVSTTELLRMIDQESTTELATEDDVDSFLSDDEII